MGLSEFPCWGGGGQVGSDSKGICWHTGGDLFEVLSLGSFTKREPGGTSAHKCGGCGEFGA